MSLRSSPLLYLFLEASTLERQRTLFESVIGLPVLETEQEGSAHRQGVVKYDAGTLIISLNQAPPGRFSPDRSDGLVTVFAVGAGWSAGCGPGDGLAADLTDRGSVHTDLDGHHHAFQVTGEGRRQGFPAPCVVELRLRASSLLDSVTFYRDVLGLDLLGETPGGARFSGTTVSICLEEGRDSFDGRAIRRDTYLLVFHTPDIDRTCASLFSRGVRFKGREVRTRSIGRLVRFHDPSGHPFCLYQPSAESLSWDSGRKVAELASAKPPIVAPAGIDRR